MRGVNDAQTEAPSFASGFEFDHDEPDVLQPDEVSAFLSPSQYARRISLRFEAIEFVPMTRQSYSASSFLDARLVPAGHPRWVPLRQLTEPMLSNTLQMSRPFYIFHSAFCCSTLLCRALDCVPGVMALKEPYIPVQIANELLGGPKDEYDKSSAWSQTELDSVHTLSDRLLRRAWPDVPRTIVKFSDRSNVMIERLLTGDPDARALFVHGNLHDFLRSVLSRRELRKWIRKERLELMLSSGHVHPTLKDVSVASMTDAQVAACVWTDRALACADLSSRFGSGVLRLVDGSRMKVAPLSVLRQAAEFFGFDHLIDSAVESNACNAAGFDSKQPNLIFQPEHRSVSDETSLLSAEIEGGVQWAEARLACVSTPMQIH